MLFALANEPIVSVVTLRISGAVVQIGIAAFVEAADSSGKFRIFRFVLVRCLTLAFVPTESVPAFGVAIAVVQIRRSALIDDCNEN